MFTSSLALRPYQNTTTTASRPDKEKKEKKPKKNTAINQPKTRSKSNSRPNSRNKKRNVGRSADSLNKSDENNLIAKGSSVKKKLGSVKYDDIDMQKQLYMIFKDQNPSVLATKAGMSFFNNLIKDFALKIIMDADELRRDFGNGQRTFVNGSDIATAIKLISRGTIATNMNIEGKALSDKVKLKKKSQIV